MSDIRKRAVVITGVSSGIGAACVDKLIASGFFVFGSVRREEDAARLQTQFGSDFMPLVFDIKDCDMILRAAQIVQSHLDGAGLAGLVNNAGMAVSGPLLYLPIADFREQLAVNLTGQLQVVQAFAPLLGARPHMPLNQAGRIIMMSSVAGRFATPFLGAYHASKFGLEGLSDALRRELIAFGVDVIVIEPGMIATPIWDKADMADYSAYDETVYAASIGELRRWAVEKGGAAPAAEKVANAVLRALTSRHPPKRISVVKNWVLDYFLPPLLPTKLADYLVARHLGLYDIQKKLDQAICDQSWWSGARKFFQRLVNRS